MKKIIFIILHSIVISIILLTFFVFLFTYPIIINIKSIKILIFLLVILATWYLYRLRKSNKCLYGFIEILIGLIIISSAIINPSKDTITGINDILKIFGGIYINIRGLDNIEKGLKSFHIINIWEKLFRQKK